MTNLSIKRGDTLTLVGELTLVAPPGGWTGYQLKSDVRAVGADGYPQGDVLGSFTVSWPDQASGAFSMSCVMDMAVPVVGFDVALIAPDDAIVTTHDFVAVTLRDRITEAPP